MDYQFLLGKLLRVHNQRYLVSELDHADGIPVARMLARVDGERVVRTFPARLVMQHLACDMPADPR